MLRRVLLSLLPMQRLELIPDDDSILTSNESHLGLSYQPLRKRPAAALSPADSASLALLSESETELPEIELDDDDEEEEDTGAPQALLICLPPQVMQKQFVHRHESTQVVRACLHL